MPTMARTLITPGFVRSLPFQHFPAGAFPYISPIHWLQSHFAVGGWSPLQRLSGMLTAHMTQIAPHNGFTWHPHRGLEIYTWVVEGTVYHEDTTGGRGEIHAGELQRMFSGDWIEHQELNLSDDYARVIQIWYMADPKYRGVEPHYQQVGRADLPAERRGDATRYALIGDGSPMRQHMDGRLHAVVFNGEGATELEPPREGESLFFYVTDGAGSAAHDADSHPLGQYDVILARPDAASITIASSAHAPVSALAFYLPDFLGAWS